MYYVYRLVNPGNGRVYIGYSANLKKRYAWHQAKDHPGWELRYYEAYADESEARLREKRLKHHGKVWTLLKKRLQKSLATVDS